MAAPEQKPTNVTAPLAEATPAHADNEGPTTAPTAGHTAQEEDQRGEGRVERQAAPSVQEIARPESPSKP